MATDKSWTTIRNRATSQAFRRGLKDFIERCRPLVDTHGRVKCPCGNCLNGMEHPLASVEKHIQRHGFAEDYDIWIHHGERLPTPVDPYSNQESQVMDEMAYVMNDIDHGDYVPEGTDVQYDKLYGAMRTELYPGISSFSSLNFLVKLMNVKVNNKWTDKSFDELLRLLKLALPNIALVGSHYEAKRLLSSLGLGYQKIHVCKYDCALFWKDHADRETCPICNEPRWQETSIRGGKTKVPHKVLRYFPITPRLKRLYAMEETAKMMRWHSLGQNPESEVMIHPRDGKAWRSFDLRHPHFSSERRNVRLGLASDGFNPFGDMSQAYSMWPVIMTVYNLPPWLCMRPEYLMLTLLIPGPKSPGKDMDVFLKPLIDELQELWSVGVDTRDAGTPNRGLFRMRAALLWTINDFPARSSLSGWSGQGYMACPTCNEDTPSVRVLGKTAYVGHRRFLPLNHWWRGLRSFNGHTERRGSPVRKSASDVIAQLCRVRYALPGKHPEYGGAKRRRHADELNWRKRSIFYELPYWATNDLKHNLDLMHIEKNVCDSLLGTILDDALKSKDTPNARRDLMQMGIRPELHLYNLGRKVMKPRAAYTLTPTNRVRLCNWIRDVRFPDGFASNLRRCISKDGGRITGLKSHDCHVIMQRLLPVVCRAFLSKDISEAILELCNLFKLLCAKSLNVSDLTKARSDAVTILCKLERIFPPAFFDVMVHLVMHLPEEAILGGPEHPRWMFSIERYLKRLKNCVRQKAKPEGSIAEGYVADEALTFCSRYLNDVETRFNRPVRNPTAVISSGLSVFQSQCFVVGACRSVVLDVEARTHAMFYILNNCTEIEIYAQEHKQSLACSGTTNVELEHKYRFQEWLYRKVFYMRQADPNSVTQEVYALASGFDTIAQSYTACIVNGIRFMTHERDAHRRTQNSGISASGVGGAVYYGVLQHILEFHFSAVHSVVLFRCKWYRCDPGHIAQDKYFTSIDTSIEGYRDDQFILATQANQVFYTTDPSRGPSWRVVHEVHPSITTSASTEDSVEIDLIHPDNSARFSLFVDLGNIERVELGNTSGSADEVFELAASSGARNDAPDTEDDDDMADDTIVEYEDVEAEEHDSDDEEDQNIDMPVHDSDFD